MVRISYYISDHGYGHATRSIAIIRRITSSFRDVNIEITCSGPLPFVKRSLDGTEGISFRDVSNDFGYVTDRDLNISHDATRVKYEIWMDSWEGYVKREMGHMIYNDVDMVISDISPQPFIAADEAGIPSMAISNFTWYEIYKDLYPGLPGLAELKGAYGKADMGLILPMETGMSPFRRKKRIGLVSREPTMGYHGKRDSLDVEEQDVLVFFSLGRSVNDVGSLRVKDPLGSPDVKFITFSGYGLEFADMIVSEEETEGQDFVNASDLVISKFGYGIVSEALRCGVPMLLTGRDIMEDRKALALLEKIGVAKRLKRKDFFKGKLDLDIEEFMHSSKQNYEKIPERYSRDGTHEVVKEITELI